jgi:hypothetical protein
VRPTRATTALAAALLLPLTARSAPPPPTLVRVDPADGRPVVVAGIVDERQASLSRAVTLELRGSRPDPKKPIAVTASATDLVGTAVTGERIVLDRSGVTVTGPAAIVPGERADYRITVGNARIPGSYAGKVLFRLAGQPPASALEVEVRAVPQIVPALVAPRPTFTMHVARCRFPLERGLARWLQPALAPDDQLAVVLRNAGAEGASVEDVGFVLSGERTGAQPGAAIALAPDAPAHAEVVPGRTVGLGVQASPGALAPDRYTGEIVVFARGPEPTRARQTLSLRAEVNVREGPALPVLLVLLGVVLGRLLRIFDTPEMKELARQLNKLRELRDRVKDLQPGPPRDELEQKLERLDRLLGRGDGTHAADLVTVERAIDLAGDVQRIERRLRPAARAAAQTALEDVRAKIAALDLEGAAKALRDLESNRGTVGLRAPDVSALANAQKTAEGGRPPRRLWGGLGSLLRIVTDIENPSARAALFFRQSIFLVLLVALLLAGMQALWVNAPTFGAGGAVDWAGLFLWGFSAEVAQRALQQGPKLLG